MDWIKVSPDTMPPDMDIVMGTVIEFEEKTIERSIAYSHKEKKWLWYDDVETCEFYPLDLSRVVTHWMPYPEPAED